MATTPYTENLLAISQYKKLRTDNLLPTCVFLSVCFLIGLFGNIIVITVYGKDKNKSATDVIILAMASFDLFTAVVGIPCELYLLYNWEQFYHKLLCHAVFFMIALGTVPAPFFLYAVTYIRYRKICKPLQTHVNARQSRLIVLAILILSTILSVLSSASSAIITDQVKDLNFSYSTCDYDTENIIYERLTIPIMTLTIAVSYPSIVYLNIRIGITAYRHRNRTNKTPVQPRISSSSSSSSNPNSERLESYENSNEGVPVKLSSSMNIKNVTISKTNIEIEKFDSNPNIAEEVYDNKNLDEIAIHVNNDKNLSNSASLNQEIKESVNIHEHKEDELKRVYHSSVNHKSTIFWRFNDGMGKTAMMLSVVSFVYVATYLPYIICRIYISVSETHIYDNGNISKYLLVPFTSIFYLGCAANPVVYCLLNSNFRKKCVDIFKLNL